VPALRLEIGGKIAVLLALVVAAPIGVVPSRNVMVMGAASGLTNADRVTAWPYVEGLAGDTDRMKTVDDAACAAGAASNTSRQRG